MAIPMVAQAGMVLTVEAIKRLTELGIAAVYIREQYVPETIEPEHVIPDILRLETVALARANLSGLRTTSNLISTEWLIPSTA